MSYAAFIRRYEILIRIDELDRQAAIETDPKRLAQINSRKEVLRTELATL